MEGACKSDFVSLCTCSMFATGSCDGTARVWRFREEGWTSMAIRIPTEELGRYGKDGGGEGEGQRGRGASYMYMYM